MRGFTVIIFGATGMIGRAVLLECIESPLIDHIHIINRKPIRFRHPKVEETLMPNFLFAHALNKHWDADAVFYCAGTNMETTNFYRYRTVTYDYIIEVCEALISHNPRMRFVLISNISSDSSEVELDLKSRVNGMAENAVMIFYEDTYILRLGYVQPMKGVETQSKLDYWFYRLIGWFYKFKGRPESKFMTNSVAVAKSMIYLAGNEFYKRRLTTENVNELAIKYGNMINDLAFEKED